MPCRFRRQSWPMAPFLAPARVSADPAARAAAGRAAVAAARVAAAAADADVAVAAAIGFASALAAARLPAADLVDLAAAHRTTVVGWVHWQARAAFARCRQWPDHHETSASFCRPSPRLRTQFSVVTCRCVEDRSASLELARRLLELPFVVATQAKVAFPSALNRDRSLQTHVRKRVPPDANAFSHPINRSHRATLSLTTACGPENSANGDGDGMEMVTRRLWRR